MWGRRREISGLAAFSHPQASSEKTLGSLPFSAAISKADSKARMGTSQGGRLQNLGVQPLFQFLDPTARPVHFPTMLHCSIAKTISDQCVKPCWKNRPTLKLRREFADSERKRRNIPLEHPQGLQKKLCFHRGLGARRGRGAGSASWRLERAKGFEPSTPTLARLCSTPELRPHRSDRFMP